MKGVSSGLWSGSHLPILTWVPGVSPQDGGEDEAPVRVLMKADPSSRESLQTEAEVDPMDGEQTWPTESELLEAEGGKRRQRFETITVAR